MGWIGAMGSGGRIVGPIITGILWDKFGQSETMIFGTVFACLALFTSFLLFFIHIR
jgi:MFS family permease